MLVGGWACKVLVRSMSFYIIWQVLKVCLELRIKMFDVFVEDYTSSVNPYARHTWKEVGELIVITSIVLWLFVLFSDLPSHVHFPHIQPQPP